MILACVCLSQSFSFAECWVEAMINFSGFRSSVTSRHVRLRWISAVSD